MKINAINCYNNNYTNNTNFKAKFSLSEITTLMQDAMKKEKHEMIAYPKLYTLLEFIARFKQEIAELSTGNHWSPRAYDTVYYANINIGNRPSHMTEIGSRKINGEKPNTYELLCNTCIDTLYQDDPRICRMNEHTFNYHLSKNVGKTREDVLSMAREATKQSNT